MAITQSDIKIYLTGAASDGGAQTETSSCLGGYRSSTEYTASTLFDDVTGDEASSGDTEYRCLCIKNEHASLDLQDAKVWIQSDTGNAEDDVSIAVETPATANLTNGDAQTIADESTAPSVNTSGHNGTGSGVSAWSDATSKATGVALSQGSHDADLGSGEVVFVWVRRTISASATAANDTFTVRIEGDTAA